MCCVQFFHTGPLTKDIANQERGINCKQGEGVYRQKYFSVVMLILRAIIAIFPKYCRIKKLKWKEGENTTWNFYLGGCKKFTSFSRGPEVCQTCTFLDKGKGEFFFKKWWRLLWMTPSVLYSYRFMEIFLNQYKKITKNILKHKRGTFEMWR